MHFNSMKYLTKWYSVENKALQCSKFELINIVVMSGENSFLSFAYAPLN